MGFTSRTEELQQEFNTSDLMVTKEDVKAAGKKLNTHNTGFLRFDKSQQIADITNEFSFQIYQQIAEAQSDDLYDLGIQFIKSMPRAAKNGDLAEHRNACQSHYNDFIMTAQNKGLGDALVAIDQRAQARHEQITNTVHDEGALIRDYVGDKARQVITEVNEHTDQVGAQVTDDVNKHTDQVGNRVIRRVNAHTTDEANRVIDANIDNNKAMLGIGETDSDGERLIRRGDGSPEYIANDDSVIGHIDNTVGGAVTNINKNTNKAVSQAVTDVNAHTDEVGAGLAQQQQENLELNNLRQTLSDMLGHEEREIFGTYNDSTVQWLGEAAGRVMADNTLTFEQKKAALNELIRMVDEEAYIGDGDKEAFEGTYFPAS